MIAATDPPGFPPRKSPLLKQGWLFPRVIQNHFLVRSETFNDQDDAARFGLNGKKYREAVLDQVAAMQQWADLVDEKGMAQTLDTP